MNVTEIKPIDIILPLKVEKYYDNDNNDEDNDKKRRYLEMTSSRYATRHLKIILILLERPKTPHRGLRQFWIRFQTSSTKYTLG